MILFKIFTWYR